MRGANSGLGENDQGKMRRKASFVMTTILERTARPSPASALVCRNCAAQYPLGAQHACFECFGPLEIGYDPAAMAGVTRAEIESRPALHLALRRTAAGGPGRRRPGSTPAPG